MCLRERGVLRFKRLIRRSVMISSIRTKSSKELKNTKSYVPAVHWYLESAPKHSSTSKLVLTMTSRITGTEYVVTEKRDIWSLFIQAHDDTVVYCSTQDYFLSLTTSFYCWWKINAWCNHFKIELKWFSIHLFPNNNDAFNDMTCIN